MEAEGEIVATPSIKQTLDSMDNVQMSKADYKKLTEKPPFRPVLTTEFDSMYDLNQYLSRGNYEVINLQFCDNTNCCSYRVFFRDLDEK